MYLRRNTYYYIKWHSTHVVYLLNGFALWGSHITARHLRYTFIHHTSIRRCVYFKIYISKESVRMLDFLIFNLFERHLNICYIFKFGYFFQRLTWKTQKIVISLCLLRPCLLRVCDVLCVFVQAILSWCP